MSKVTTILMLSAVLMFVVSSAVAIPIKVNSKDTLPQDVLITQECLPVHELGTSGVFFDDDEGIECGCVETSYRPCDQNPDDPGIPNIEVSIFNCTTRDWLWLYYVADPETGLTNDDGLVNDCLAFQIDAVGANRPLISESMAADGVFQVGETWVFVIQDYVNAPGLSACALNSVGVGAGGCGFPGSGGDVISSGSIIPEPGTMALLVLGGIGALMRRRRRKA